jgi:glycogen debranching enzyme
VENYKITGDKSRFKEVLPALEKYAEWLEKYRRKEGTAHNLYWQTGLGSGMDNTPREGSGWIDMSAQMAMYYKDLAFICGELKLADKQKQYADKSADIAARINKFMWNESDGIYYDVDDNGSQLKHKTVASFWPMLAGICSQEQAEKLVKHLKDPKEFWRKIPFPSLAADEHEYKAEGDYWLGGVWAPTNTAIIKGLEHYGYNEFAYLATENYLAGMYEVYKRTGTIWENYSPEAYSRGIPAKPDFVGWSGCGPIQLLIENILGFAPNGAENKLAWNVTRIDGHGIKNLRFGSVTVSLIAEKRESVTSPVIINVACDGAFELTVIHLENKQTFKLEKGTHSLTIN